MTLPAIIQTIGPGGVAAALLALAGAALRVYAWRARARDLREHAARLAAATTAEQRAILEANPPPPLDDRVLKALIVILLGGIAASACAPAARLVTAMRGPVERCLPRCGPRETCVGRICTMQASPLPAPPSDTTATAQSAPSRAPASPVHPVGPQSAVEPALASQRWVDNYDFPNECGQ